MGKNKKTSSAKRQAKALKRRTERKKAKGQKTQQMQIARGVAKRNHAKFLQELSAWEQDPKGYGFWACQGINYLASDMEQGVWDPPFPEIYEDNGTMLPDPERVQAYIYKHINPEEPTFSKLGRTLLGFWMAGSEGIYGLSLQAIKRAEEAGEDPYAPSQASLWGFFNEVHGKVDAELGDKHLSEETLASEASV